MEEGATNDVCVRGGLLRVVGYPLVLNNDDSVVFLVERATLASSRSLKGDEEEEENIDHSTKKRKKKKKEKEEQEEEGTGKEEESITASVRGKECVIRGDPFCREISSPLMRFTLLVEKDLCQDESTGKLVYSLRDFVSIERAFSKITQKTIVNTLLKSKYWGGPFREERKKKMIKNTNLVLGGPLSENHDLKPNDQIVGDDQMECVYETLEKKDEVIMRRVMKNAFLRSRDEMRRLESLWLFSCPLAHLVLTQEDWKTIHNTRGDFLPDEDENEEGRLISGRLMRIWERVYLKGDWEKEEIVVPDLKKLRVRFPRFLDPERNSYECWSLNRTIREVSWVSELKERTKYGDACIRIDSWKKNPREITVTGYEKYEDIYEDGMGIRVWQDTKTKTTYLMKSRVYEMQEKITDWIKTKEGNGGTIIRLVKAEIDDDHEDPEGYFDFLSGLVTKDVAIITTCAKRVTYLHKHTEIQCTYFDPDDDVNRWNRSLKPPEIVIIDRTHVLGLKEFEILLRWMDNLSPTIGEIYFCGSPVCHPENGTIGCPFSDMVLSGSFEMVDLGKNDRQAILNKKVGRDRYYQNLKDAIKSCTKDTAEKSYVFVSSGKQKQIITNQNNYEDEEGRNVRLTDDQVKHYYQIRYDLPPRPTIFLLINKTDGKRISHSHLAKCLSCSSTNPQSVVIVGGTREEVNGIRSYTRWRSSTLKLWIGTLAQPPGSPNETEGDGGGKPNNNNNNTSENKKRKVEECGGDAGDNKESKTEENPSPRSQKIPCDTPNTNQKATFVMCPTCGESVHRALSSSHAFEKHG